MSEEFGKKINGQECALSKIFSSEFEFHIPTYQRPYAWTTDQARELFDDLYDFYKNENSEGYFLGSIVLIKNEGNPHSWVIDGQQRLTTLTILLACFGYHLGEKNNGDLLEFLSEPGNKFKGLAPKPRLTLRDRDAEFFKKYVQDMALGELIALDEKQIDNEAKVNIKKNSGILFAKIKEKFASDKDDLASFIEFILTRCFLVAVSTPSQKSAFRVFSVMNSRGLDLQPTDIFKADIIGKLPDKQKDEYSEKWEDLETDLGRSVFNDLFSHVRMIYSKEKARATLLEEFGKVVMPKFDDKPTDLVDHVLEPYGEALKTIKNMSYKSTENAKDINQCLYWLNRIENFDWIPPSLLFLSLKKNDPDWVLYFFEKIERLSSFMYLCSYDINQRIERYARVIAEIESMETWDYETDNLETLELTSAEQKEFKEKLNGDIYTMPSRKRNYAILRLDSFVSDGAASYDPSVLTIEHVLPQTADGAGYWEELFDDKDWENWVHKISNLVPLNKRKNSEAQNYDFETKKNIYFKSKNSTSSYALTTQVISEAAWDLETLKARQKKLMKSYADNWDL